MSVGKQGSAQVTVSFDDAPGGTLRAISGFVMELGGVKISVGQVASHMFADAWEKSNPTGVMKTDPIKIGGFFDTTTVTGPHVVFNPVAGDSDPNGATRTLTIVFGDSKTFTVECRLGDYEVVASIGTLTKFAATVIPTATATWS